MKHRILGFSFFVFTILNVSGQNPFQSIGKSGKVLTLSKGKYDEVTNNDSIQRIGTVLVNIRTKQIVNFIQYDTVYSESTLEPTIISRHWSIDPKAHAMPGWSPYNSFANNPILMVDPDGQLPWPIHVRSFISTSTTGGGLFRGDGRGPSLSTASNVTSRVRTSFVVDPAKGVITNPIPVSDPTVFYGGYMPGFGFISPKVEKGTPTASIMNEKFSKNKASFDFSHSGKDPITPSAMTPSLDVHSGLTINEDLEKGVLSVSGSFTGDVFPSTEAFIVDQSGKTKLFLGAVMEKGGIGDLFGDNKENLFKVNMQINLDKKGNFTGVTQGDKTYSVEEWNAQFTTTSTNETKK